MKDFNDLSKSLLLRFNILICFLCAISYNAGSETLNLHVRDGSGRPIGGVIFQIFPKSPGLDSDVQPIEIGEPRTDEKDNDGDGSIDEEDEDFPGYATDSQGRLSLDLRKGRYTVVGFSRTRHLLLMRSVDVPGSFIIDSSETIPVNISCRYADNSPISGAEVFLRPTKCARASIGYSNNSGVITAYVSKGEYNAVLWSSRGIGPHYLVLPHVQISEPQTSLNFHVSKLPTCEINFILPKTTVVSIFEVLESSHTNEYSRGLEPEVGYDAAYTDFYPFVDSKHPYVLSANMNYKFNLSFAAMFGPGVIYAYELHTPTIYVTPGKRQIGMTEKDSFLVSFQTENNRFTYKPGEKLKLSFFFKNPNGDLLWRILNFSGARMVFPSVTVLDPHGLAIANNFANFDFTRFEFDVPVSTTPGSYKIEVSLDAGMFGTLKGTFEFLVETDNVKEPIIEDVAFPKESQAGKDILFSVKITDSTGLLGSPEMLISSADHQKQISYSMVLSPMGIFEVKVPWRDIKAGALVSSDGQELEWRITATNTYGAQAEKLGKIIILDKDPPYISHELVRSAEVGVELKLRASIDDDIDVSHAVLHYLVNGKDKSVAMDKDQHDYTATIPADDVTFKGLSYYISAIDSSNNVAFFPDGGGRPEACHVNVFDNTPPVITHLPINMAQPNRPLRIEAAIKDNNGIAHAKVLFETQTGSGSIEMVSSGDIFYAEVPSKLVVPGLISYQIEATDLPDPEGNTRTSTSAINLVKVSTSERLLYRLEITPSADPLTIRAGDTVRFSATGLSIEGEIVPTDVAWFVTGDIGFVSQEGIFYAKGEIRGDGLGRITAISINTPTVDGNPVYDELTIKINPAPLHSIVLNPSSVTTHPGGSIKLFLNAYDLYGNAVSTSGADFKIVPHSPTDPVRGLSMIPADDGSFIQVLPTKAGRYVVVARLGGAEVQSEIMVLPGQVERIEIRSSKTGAIPVKVMAGEVIKFFADAYDSFGNKVEVMPTWSVLGGIGDISADGSFSGWKAGYGQVVATFGDVSSSVDVQVIPGKLHHVTVSPYTVYLPVSTSEHSSTQQFAADGWDIAGNPVPITSVSWRTDAFAGTISPSGLFTATTDPGVRIGEMITNGTIYATATSSSGERVTGYAYVGIQRSSASKISYIRAFVHGTSNSLDRISVATGESIRFEAVGVDSKGRYLSIVPTWTVIGNIGRITSDGLFTATNPGMGTVVAMMLGYTAKIDVNVNPGKLKYLEIRPNPVYMEPGMEVTVNVYGYDSYGNSITLDDNVQWQTDKSDMLSLKATGLTCAIRLNNVYEPSAIIYAMVDNVLACANVIVNWSDVILATPFTPSLERRSHYIEVHPDVVAVKVGAVQRFTADVFDVLGRKLDATKISWNVLGDIGKIDSSGLFVPKDLTGQDFKKGFIIATDGKLYGCALVTILKTSISSDELIIFPKSLKMQVGSKQKFVALIKKDNMLMIPAEQVAWSINDGIGNIDPNGELSALRVGTGAVKVQFGTLLNSADITVTNSDIESVEMSASYLSLKAGQQQRLSLTVRDGLGNPLNAQFEVHPVDNLNISYQNEVLSASRVGFGTVLVICKDRYETIVNRLKLRVEASEPSVIEIYPSDVQAISGSSVMFNAVCKDIYGNITVSKPTWDDISQNGIFIADKVGEFKVHARIGKIVNQARIVVIPGEPTYAIVKPAFLSVPARDVVRKQFEVALFDGQGNAVTNADVEDISWTVTKGIGEIDPKDGIFQSVLVNEERMGYVNVTLKVVNSNRVIRSSSAIVLTLDEGVSRIDVFPNNISVIKGAEQRFTAIGKNYNNVEVEIRPYWKVTSEIDNSEIKGAISSDGVFKALPEMQIGSSWNVIAFMEDGKQGIAKVTITTGPINFISIKCDSGNGITDCPSSIASGESIQLVAIGYDSYLNQVEFDPEWKLVGQIGRLLSTSGTNTTLVAGSVGQGEIICSYKGKESRVSISVLPGQLSRLEIRMDLGKPLPKEPILIEAGHEIQLFAIGYDSDTDEMGNPKPVNRVDVSPLWSVIPPFGAITSFGKFVPRRTGNCIISASVGNLTSSVSVRIIPGELKTIKVTPPEVTLATNVNEFQQFYAEGYDAQNNLIPDLSFSWHVTNNIGDIDDKGYFTPAKLTEDKLSGLIVASIGDVYGYANVTIVPYLGEISSIVLSIEPSIIRAGKTASCYLKGIDTSGHVVSNIPGNVALSVSGDLGALERAKDGLHWTFHAIEVLPNDADKRRGSIEAKVEINGKSLYTRAEFQLVPEELHHISISPARAQIIAGSLVSLVAEGRDVYDNYVELKEVSWKLIGNGTLTPDGTKAVFQGFIAGEVNVLLSSHGLEGRSTIMVIPARVTKLEVEADQAITIEAGSSKQLAAVAKDQFGNVVQGVQPSWKVVKGFENGSLDSSGTFKALRSGKVTLVAVYEEVVSNELLITVVPGPISKFSIVISQGSSILHEPFTLLSGSDYELTIKTFDSLSNHIPDMRAQSWHLPADLGTITSDGRDVRLKALFPGSGSIKAEIGSLSSKADIRVIPHSRKVNPKDRAIITGPMGLVMEIQPGSLRREVEISIALTKLPRNEGKRQIVGYAYSFLPLGEILSIPAKLTLPYGYASVSEDPHLSVYSWDTMQGTWVREGGIIDVESKTISVEVNHLSIFAIGKDDVPVNERLSIKEIHLSPNAFFAPDVNRLTISYLIGASSDQIPNVSIDIYDIRGNLVRKLIDKSSKYVGWNTDLWDGRDEKGELVENGRYFVVITAEIGDQKVSKVKHLVVFK